MLTIARLVPVCWTACVFGQDLNPVHVALDLWANGLDVPVEVRNAGDGRLFVVERAGVVRIVTDSMEVAADPFLDIQDRVNDFGHEQGLLSIAFAPEHATSGHFYVYYIYADESTGIEGLSRISRFGLLNGDPDEADPNSEQIVYAWPQPQKTHNGGTLQFGADGYLYFAFGDGGGPNDPLDNGQDLSDPLGDMIRIDVSLPGDTFGIPPDNPFVDAAGDTLPEIWASGLRNPWRWSFDPATGDVWLADVGQLTWEELDYWPAGAPGGRNMGWSCREGLIATPDEDQAACGTADDYAAPIAVFDHTVQTWCAIIGGYVYRGTAWPHLAGKYIFTDYCAGDLLAATSDGQVDTLLMSEVYGASSFGTDHDGELYLTNETNGTLHRIRDACPMAAPAINDEGGVLTCTEALTYQWYLDGMPIAGATGQEWTPEGGGSYSVVANFGEPCTLRSDTLQVIITGMVGTAGPVMHVFPQPANGVLHIEFDRAVGNGLRLQLADVTGRRVMGRPLAAGERHVQMDLSDLSPGTYLLQAGDARGAMVQGQRVIVGP